MSRHDLGTFDARMVARLSRGWRQARPDSARLVKHRCRVCLLEPDPKCRHDRLLPPTPELVAQVIRHRPTDAHPEQDVDVSHVQVNEQWEMVAVDRCDMCVLAGVPCAHMPLTVVQLGP